MFTFFIICPPQEIQLVGLALPTLFSRLLGSEELYFVHYHIVRICLTLVVHSFLPLGYYLFSALYLPNLDLFNLKELNIYWKIYLGFSILFALGLNTLVYYWYMNTYDNHPVANKLRKFSETKNWRQVANQINTEFRRYDKFTSGNSVYNRLYLTDSWLVKVNQYSLNISPSQNIDLTLTNSIELNLAYDGAPSHQLLNILIKPIEQSLFKPFNIRLNSLEYKDFNDKLNLPIRQTCDIIIKQSLPEQFLDAFKDTVMRNETYIETRQVSF